MKTVIVRFFFFPQRHTHYTHEKSRFSNGALLYVRGVEASLRFFWGEGGLFNLKEPFLDLLWLLFGRAKSQEVSIWLFGICHWKLQKHIYIFIYIKYNVNDIIISENHILSLIGLFFSFIPSFAFDCPCCPPNRTRQSKFDCSLWQLKKIISKKQISKHLHQMLLAGG